MPTLLLSHRYTDDSNALWRAAVACGWEVERLLSYRVSEELAGKEPVIYSETLLADAISETLGLVLLEPTHDWLPRLPDGYRKRDIQLTTLGDARAMDRRAFVKPVDEKLFAARVYANGREIDANRVFSDASPVLISEPVTWSFEVRAFIVERQCATLSAYLRNGEIAKSEDGLWPLADDERAEALGFLDGLLADPRVALPPAVVVDFGRTVEHGWAVVEANPCWASGICGCDPREVLRVVRRANVPISTLSEEDRPWSRAAHMAAMSA